MENIKREKTIEELRVELDEAIKAYETAKDNQLKRELEEKKRKEEELSKEKETRETEIRHKEQELLELYKAFIRDYGSISTWYKFDDYDDFFNCFWNHDFIF